MSTEGPLSETAVSQLDVYKPFMKHTFVTKYFINIKRSCEDSLPVLWAGAWNVYTAQFCQQVSGLFLQQVEFCSYQDICKGSKEL